MSEEDARRWYAARTLPRLAAVMADWLEGAVQSRPGYFGRPDPEIAPLVPVLAACNRAGFLTDDSQPGEQWDHDGAQRAAIAGFVTTGTLRALLRHLEGTDLTIIAHTSATALGSSDTAIGVSIATRGMNTWYGTQLDREHLEHTFGAVCHPAAVRALCGAWQVSVIDLQWGRNGLLWAALERFASSRG